MTMDLSRCFDDGRAYLCPYDENCEIERQSDYVCFNMGDEPSNRQTQGSCPFGHRVGQKPAKE